MVASIALVIDRVKNVVDIEGNDAKSDSNFWSFDKPHQLMAPKTTISNNDCLSQS